MTAVVRTVRCWSYAECTHCRWTAPADGYVRERTAEDYAAEHNAAEHNATTHHVGGESVTDLRLFDPCVRFPTDLHDQLVRAAADRNLSVNWLVNAAVKDFLARLLPADEIRPTGDPTGGET